MSVIVEYIFFDKRDCVAKLYVTLHHCSSFQTLTSSAKHNCISSSTMILDPTSSNHLKPWLVRTLEPMWGQRLKESAFCTNTICCRCDAEPNALGDYILALMRHDVGEAEMRKELSSQLEEFLERGMSNSHLPKVSLLMRCLRNTSFPRPTVYSATHKILSTLFRHR